MGDESVTGEGAALRENALNRLGLELPSATDTDEARLVALSEGFDVEFEPTSLVAYRSHGLLLIIGAEPAALDAAAELIDKVNCVVLVPDAQATPNPGDKLYEKKSVRDQEVPVIHAAVNQLVGYLGDFSVTVSLSSQEVDLAKAMSLESGFDIVLDLRRQPGMAHEVLPPGYFAPAGDDKAFQRAMEEIPDLTGEFEKPRFIHYNPDICAHGERGVTGCTRCLEVCPADALTSLNERIHVETHLCQGMGSCATACPTGALRYGYPGPTDTINALRKMIARYRTETSVAPVVLFYSSDYGGEALGESSVSWVDHLLPWQVEEPGTVGMDVWLSCLAFGAGAVRILASEETPESVSTAVKREVGYTNAMAGALGLDPESVAVVADVAALMASSDEVRSRGSKLFESGRAVATFGDIDEKRVLIRLAMDQLVSIAAAVPEMVAMPAQAPFGEIRVDKDACTLCMSCVAVCPVGALSDGVDTPRLDFQEWNCVQCGMCERTCPENAISLHPRFVFDARARIQKRTLNEEAPFRCIDCGKPFTTQSMIKRMEEKLSGHRMFQGDAINRLKKCEDCRVKDMFAE